MYAQNQHYRSGTDIWLDFFEANAKSRFGVVYDTLKCVVMCVVRCVVRCVVMCVIKVCRVHDTVQTGSTVHVKSLGKP